MKSRASVLATCLICAAFAASPAESAPWSALLRAGKKADTAADAAGAGSKVHAALNAGRMADRAYKASTTNDDRGATGRPTTAVQGDGGSRFYGITGAAMLLMAVYLFFAGRRSRR